MNLMSNIFCSYCRIRVTTRYFTGKAILGGLEIFVKAIHRHNTASLLPLLFNSDFANIAAISNNFF
ncbi:hypothetical protein KsCSTR_07000 [Candidatus Kuenenia stuttgartiensis]|uniref:Uncharacterized protein n=1 Tax=Kuenenia stuttgartiensis TaxID=174633 RepID=Q1PZN0_KUEST|nr:hypothetical protein KsCSTR_07000 [Candidatus Kuenenia stuttgartiensis]CAJ72543.1 unknown protein [Candidatus Kuenenia stuttgartiensis]